MTQIEKDKLLRIVEEIYKDLRPITHSPQSTTSEKIAEINRWRNDFLKRTLDVHKIYDESLASGLIPESDKQEMKEAIEQISRKYID